MEGVPPLLQVRSDNVPSSQGNMAAKKTPKSTVESVYQRKTQLEHILLRPDSYIGVLPYVSSAHKSSVEFEMEQMWVYDREQEKIIQKDISYVPGLYKIFDEILVNAADNKQRDPNMDIIKVDIDLENNHISIYNNGKGIPVVMHKEEKMYIPTMIFGHLLTSSNYNDAEEKVTGGRNGYGAKLCNIFSTKFTVETASKEYHLHYKQSWADNMSKASEAKIKSYDGEDFTRVTFSPDLRKFRMDCLDSDIVALMSRRALDVAASTKGVKVYLNGKRVPVSYVKKNEYILNLHKTLLGGREVGHHVSQSVASLPTQLGIGTLLVRNFKDYVDLYLKDKVDDAGGPIKPVYENVNARWEVAVALSNRGFQQMSFVNSIATTKGGRHVDYVTDSLVKSLSEALKKKNKSGVQIKPFQIKNQLWVFMNCLIVNPTFDSQTKESMTLQAKNFGSKCVFSEKFTSNLMKCGVVEAVLTWAKFKQEAQLQSKCAGKKHTKIKGIPKLEDANDAGTKDSSSCTLILTEGDSAKTLAVAGLSVVGRDRFGIFPLRGKLLNVRDASHRQILENAEINNIIKILGLQYKKKYETEVDMKTLRYGKLMIMADQDQDGSHIKGLLINFIHHNWPTLLRRPFMEEFITPIVKASKGGQEIAFYSLPEYEEWKKSQGNWHTYKIKYYKGLGTSTSKEAKEYFVDMTRHRIVFNYSGTQDDQSIQMAFSKKAAEQRKEWLTEWMEECKQRRELGLPDIYLYEKNTRSVTYSDFVNKELVLFSNLDNERSIPCMVDGLKPGQRKVLYTCLKRNDKREVKVAQLAGSVAEHSAYHHGETSLMSTIINLAQDYVGSNNINLLLPIGQFGTRLQGGKDSASPRYIFTMLSKLTRTIFHPHDEPLLKSNFDDNQRIEPEWYIPILPMVLVNGAEGIGTGWSTRIPNYNPREIVKNLKRMVSGEEPEKMKPWFRGFRGTVEEVDPQRYVIHGEVADLGHNKIEITELPIRVWTQTYKETIVEPLLIGSEKTPPLITDFKEYHTDTTVRFVVTMTDDKFRKALADGMHKTFKLQGSMSTSCMVLFDHNGVLRKYETVEEILKEFFGLRLQYYIKRKAYMVGMLEAEASKLSNQARFILEKCDGTLVIENKRKKDMIVELQRKGYDSDPVKSWKKLENLEATLEEEQEEEKEPEDEEASKGNDYDYLLGMKMWSLTLEKKNEILKNRDDKRQELEVLKEKSPEALWSADLNDFIEQLNILEAEEADGVKVTKKARKKGKRDDDDNDDDIQISKTAAKNKSKKAADANATKPSAYGERILPHVDVELKKKFEKAAAAKEKKEKMGKRELEEAVDFDEFDVLVATATSQSLAARLGASSALNKRAQTKKPGDGLKQTKLTFRKTGRKRNEGSSDEDINLSDVSLDLQPRENTSSRRATAMKVKYTVDESSNSSSGEEEFHASDGVKESEMVVSNSILNDSDVDKSDKVKVSDTDSESEKKPTRKRKAAPPPQGSCDDEPKLKKKPGPTKTATVTHSGDFDNDGHLNQNRPGLKRNLLAKAAIVSDKEDIPKPKRKPGHPKKTAAAKERTDSASPDMFEEFSDLGTKIKGRNTKDAGSDTPPPQECPGRQRKAPIVYLFSDNEEFDDDY